MTTTEAAPQAEAVVATVADPAPLGLAGFAMTTAVLSVFNAGILPANLTTVVLPLALFYGGIGQFAAGMWEFKNRNTFGALAFSSYGAFWLAYASYAKFVAPGLPAATAYKATGLFLVVWTVFTLYMTIAAAKVNVAVLAVFVLLTVTFLFLAIGAFDTSSTSITKIGGYLGLVTAVAAWYASMAIVVNSTWKRTVFPLVPLG